MLKNKSKYLFCIAVGLLTAIFFCIKYIEGYHYFEDTYISYWARHNFEIHNKLKEIVFARIKYLAPIILISSFLKKRTYKNDFGIAIMRIICCLFCVALGLSAGIICIDFGLGGLLIIVFAFFPHYFFYGLAVYFLLAKKSENYNNKLREIIIPIMLIVIGILVEAYWSFELIQKMTRMVI